MAACEPCWNEAFRQSRLVGGSQVDHYLRLLEIVPNHPHDTAPTATIEETPMPELDLDALTAVAEAGTPGPWDLHMVQPDMGGRHQYGLRSTGRGPERAIIGATFRAEARNASHIATFDPPTVLALIAEAREAERLREGLRRMLTAPSAMRDNGLMLPGDRETYRVREIRDDAIRALIGGAR